MVSIVHATAYRVQSVHNEEVREIETDQVIADEMWSFVKKQKQCGSEDINLGDCWIGVISLAKQSGLILTARVGKHTDAFLEELITSTEGKTDCRVWYARDREGYERVLPPEVIHIAGKGNTQRLERTNGIIRQQTGRWH